MRWAQFFIYLTEDLTKLPALAVFSSDRIFPYILLHRRLIP